MFKSEFVRIKASVRAKWIILIMMLIPMISLLEGIYWEYIIYFIGGAVPVRSNMAHPCMRAFLSGMSNSQISQMLLIWLLPVFLLIVYDDEYLIDKNNNCFHLILSRCDKKQVYFTRLTTSFFVGFILVLITVATNFILSVLLFHGGQSFFGLESNAVIGKELQHPYLFYIVKTLLFSLISGILSVFCQAISYIVKNLKFTYFICSFFWIIMILSPYSITYCIQPFIEYGIKYVVVGMAIFMTVSVIFIFLTYEYKVRSDEL